MKEFDRLREYLKNVNEYKKAVSLYETGCVDIRKSNSFWKSDVTISGIVFDGDIQHSSVITVVDKKPSSCTCDCDYYNKNKCFCAHIGALYLAHCKEENKSNKLIYTSMETRKTVNYYLNRNIRESNVATIKDVNIFCDIKLVKQRIEAVFYLEKGDKKYKIKNLFEFCRFVEEKSVYKYGRNFIFQHSRDNINENSLKLFDFLIANIKNEKMLCLINGSDEVFIVNNFKMILVGENIDRFINILYESDNEFVCNHKSYKISYETPYISLKLTEDGYSGYMLNIDNIDGYIEGNDTLYLFDEEGLYKTDNAFYSEMRVFIKNIFENINHTLSINKNDMSSFCNCVIPILIEFCNVEMPDRLLQKYEPWELKCKFILEKDKENINLKIESKYRNEDFDLLRGICADKNVCRDYNLEYLIKNTIEKYHFVNTVNGKLVLSEYEHIYEFLKNGVIKLKAIGEVEISEELLNMRLVEKMKIGASISVDNNWLNLNINADGYSREDLELLISAYREKKRFVKLNSSTIVKLDDNDLELLAGMAYDLDFTAEDLVNNNIFLPRYRAMYLDSRLSGNISLYSKDNAFKSLVRTIKQVENSEIPVPPEFMDVLRDYQKNGFRWLKTMDECGFGGILADDMGLGKTIQILALLVDEYIVRKNKKKSLIVVPTSLIYNWENEIHKFAGKLNTVAVVGAKSERTAIITNSNADIFITSYELLKRDINEYAEIEFRFEILDEAQNIKNYITANARSVKKIKAETRFALTGTPIENHLSDLWSIFDFVMPGFLYTNRKFRDKFEIPILKDKQKEAVNGLKRMISPFILRREKTEVLKELPEKLEYNLFAKMEGEQYKLYTANAARLKEELEHNDNTLFNSNKIRFLAEITKLRQICCSPSLCYEDYEEESAKLELCIDLIKDCISGGHKILLFSQFTSMLEIIADRLLKENISFYTMTGATNKEDRMFMVNKFNKDMTSVFLISLRVGGTGLNLTSADIVIHYDPWWNVAVQNQATDRAHRIGQERIVSVFKLIAKDSVEENILSLQQSKAKLSNNFINGKNISLSNLSKEELLSILNG